MTNTNELRRRVARSGYKYKALARKMGICPSTLQRKIENQREFTVSEMDDLAELLGLTLREKTAIFFCKNRVI